ncbi:DUF397 domain-containing protein [Actinacidiphila oryziradicis]|uniref:DUF397 domain-containing protein n=1 Tax=Actinacidiphila oryziradicis TaxID=2571141 RepID=A0A4U0ST73_9ACTN|nr:DUF397 domain-containing protein [Actinacidiphila oryziradicis]
MPAFPPGRTPPPPARSNPSPPPGRSPDAGRVRLRRHPSAARTRAVPGCCPTPRAAGSRPGGTSGSGRGRPSADNNCVEVAASPDGRRIHLRESEDPTIILTAAPAVLGTFIRAIKSGELQQPS